MSNHDSQRVAALRREADHLNDGSLKSHARKIGTPQERAGLQVRIRRSNCSS